MEYISEPRSHLCYAGPHMHTHAPRNVVNADLMRAEQFDGTGIPVECPMKTFLTYFIVYVSPCLSAFLKDHETCPATAHMVQERQCCSNACSAEGNFSVPVNIHILLEKLASMPMSLQSQTSLLQVH